MMFIYVRVTAVAQWVKTPGIHCSVAGSIPVTPRYRTKKIRNALWSTKKMCMYMLTYIFMYLFVFVDNYICMNMNMNMHPNMH